MSPDGRFVAASADDAEADWCFSTAGPASWYVDSLAT